MPKNVTLGDFLTEAEIKRATKLYNKTAEKKDFNERCLNEIILPNIERINAALGQENDPRFLAYAVEYVLLHANRNPQHA